MFEFLLYHPADFGPQGFTLALGRYLFVNQKTHYEGCNKYARNKTFCVKITNK